MLKLLRRLFHIHSYRSYVVLPEDINLLEAIANYNYKREQVRKIRICRECGKIKI